MTLNAYSSLRLHCSEGTAPDAESTASDLTLSLSVIPKLWYSYFCIFSLNYHMIRRGLKNVGKMLQFSPSTEQRAILIFLRFQDKALL